MYIRRESPTPLSETIPHGFISRARDTEVFTASPGGAELWHVESTVTNLTVLSPLLGAVGSYRGVLHEIQSQPHLTGPLPALPQLSAPAFHSWRPLSIAHIRGSLRPYRMKRPLIIQSCGSLGKPNAQQCSPDSRVILRVLPEGKINRGTELKRHGSCFFRLCWLPSNAWWSFIFSIFFLCFVPG